MRRIYQRAAQKGTFAPWQCLVLSNEVPFGTVHFIISTEMMHLPFSDGEVFPPNKEFAIYTRAEVMTCFLCTDAEGLTLDISKSSNVISRMSRFHLKLGP